THPEIVCGFSYKSPYRFLDPNEYTRKQPCAAVEIPLDLGLPKIEIDVWLCPHAAVEQLSARYSIAAPYVDVAPAIVFCSGTRSADLTIRTIYPRGWKGE